MEIQWLGTSGFRIRSGGSAFLLDPYLSRNIDARPRQELGPKDLGPVSHVFLSHGHFDHAMDVPDIAGMTRALVACSPVVAASLMGHGLSGGQILEVGQKNREISFGQIRARAFFSRHIRFDLWLLLSTLGKINFKIPGIIPLFSKFPCGQVLSWRFYIKGRVIHFFGSAGARDAELESLKDEPLDILLIPLQGHSRICEIAARQVKILEPKLVIPHHQDNFFPPVSKSVDIGPFIRRVKRACPGTGIRVMEMNEIFTPRF